MDTDDNIIEQKAGQATPDELERTKFAATPEIGDGSQFLENDSRPPFSRLAIRWANQRFDLHANRAMHWRRAHTLIIADPHFGKAAAFRVRGVPVPQGTTQRNLDRLSMLLAQTRAKRLIVLGDFFHARVGRADATMAAIELWRQLHSALQIILVRGNHDQHAGDPPAEWNCACVDEPFIDGKLAFFHDPATARDFAQASNHATFTLAGHIHPSAILHDDDGSTMRVACFHFSPRHAVLPAFGAFTGMHPVRPCRGDRVFAVGPNAVIEVRCGKK